MQQPPTPPIEPGPLQDLGARPVQPRTAPDKGTARSRLIAVLLVVVLYSTMAVLQNATPYMQPKEDSLGREPRGGEVVKLMLLFDRAFAEAGMPTGNFGAMAAAQFADQDMHPADRLQAVLALGEAQSAEAGLDWLAAIRSGQDLGALAADLTAGGDWRGAVIHEGDSAAWAQVEQEGQAQSDEEALADARAMEALYTFGPAALNDEQEARLRDRYGWLGELSLTHGLEPSDPARAALFADIPWAIALIVVVLIVMLVALLGGLVMAIVAAVLFFSGKLRRRFVPPSPGGSVYLETFAAFLVGFALVQLGAGVVAAVTGDTPALRIGTLLAQWALILAVFWPRARGVSGGEWRESVGWRAPKGVAREVLAGVGGYFAGLPLLLLAMLFTVVLNLVWAEVFGAPDEPPTNPVLELVSGGSAIEILLFVTLATIWAPIVEETVFRGAVYRHMRARAGAFLCALATALLFAFMHSYGPLMTAPLIALGFTFAMIREWRGSLIGSMTAHCLHNSVITGIIVLGVRAMS